MVTRAQFSAPNGQTPHVGILILHRRVPNRLLVVYLGNLKNVEEIIAARH